MLYKNLIRFLGRITFAIEGEEYKVLLIQIFQAFYKLGGLMSQWWELNPQINLLGY